jgi:hypothetical protein
MPYHEVMNIFLAASKSAYVEVGKVKIALEAFGHMVTSPNGFDDPNEEGIARRASFEAYSEWKAAMIREDGRIIAQHDGVLVLNFDKDGQANYVGGATFLEMFKAFDLGKKLFLYNPIPEGVLTDEIIGLQPIVIHGDLSLIG